MALNFATKVDYAVGDAPAQVAVGDINGDGITDIVTSNWNSKTVSLLLGMGDGTFFGPTDLSLYYRPYDLAIADINSDNVNDIFTLGHWYGLGVDLLTNNGIGGFETSKPIYTNSEAWREAFTIGDFNADNSVDIAVIRYDAYDHSLTSAYIYQNNGDGTFSEPTTWGLNGEPYSAVVADINADGFPDIATANYANNSISVITGKEDGSFNSPTMAGVGTSPKSIAVGDVNSDGKMDVVTANYDGKTVSILPGNGKGLFGIAPTFNLGVNPNAVALGDLNSDGKLDLVTANTNKTVSIAIGNGNGTFATAISADIGTNPSGLALKDVNNDSMLDIIVSNQDNDTVSVLLNTSTGSTIFTKVGTAGNDALVGTTGNDILQGLGGADAIKGESGNDQLFGGIGRDTLFGGDGNDVIDGGINNDTITGESGQDIFQITTAYNVDKITDFSSLDDTLQLENTIFGSLEKTGALDTSMLRAGSNITSAADANDYLIYNSKTGVLYYDDDANGKDSVAVKIAILGTATHPNLTATDIVVI